MADEEEAEQSLERVEDINIEEEMRVSFIDYSMSVIVSRALPDARDGLKPVHRRVLYAMRELGNTHSKAYKKSARVVGDTIGKYHPHGDTAVYYTIVRMAQEFSLRYTLVDGQGNFGSIDGDAPAAMRYTEVRMDHLAEELLADIDKDTVNFGPNYDGSLQQPLVLPSKFPNLLLNGSTGIAVGMATNIPPHNMNELTNAIVHLIDNPEATPDDLMQHVKGPDFPTGGIICGTAPIAEMYRTGRGHMRLRGRAHIDDEGNKPRIIITEVPYTVNKAKMVEHLIRLAQAKVLDGISDVRDESSSEGIRVVIELKRGVVPKVLLNNIYKHTQMQTTFAAVMLALDDGRPRVMNLREMLLCFTNHRYEVVTRRTQYDLAKAEARAHILEGLKIALDHLDDVVKTIRAAKNRDEARTEIRAKFKLSEIQANAILDMRLYQLTGLEREKLEKEYLELIKHISYLTELLASDEQIYDVIKGELVEIQRKFGDMRRTDIAPDEGEINIEDLVADRGCIITISHTGYIRRVPIDTYKAQRRGGKGVAGMGTKEEDYVQSMFVAHTHDYILFFTQSGRLYWEKVYEIPEAGRTARGKAIVNLLNIRTEEKIAAMIRVREFADTQHLVMATERGVVKKTNLSAFGNPRADGIIGINIDEGDRLIGVKLTSGQDEVMIATQKGMCIRFHEDQLRDQGRATRGVRGITLREEDAVESLEIVNESATYLTCTENGYGKRSRFDDYRSQNRGGRGIIAIRTSKRNGSMVGAHSVVDTDSLMLITAQGKMIKMEVSDIRVISRATQGVRLINLGAKDKLVAATTVEPEDTESLDIEPDTAPASPELASEAQLDEQPEVQLDEQPEAQAEEQPEAPAEEE
jgi:DNA gyrase subunit A